MGLWIPGYGDERGKKSLLSRLALSYLVALSVLAISADWIIPHNPIEVNYQEALHAPSFKHPFGTDTFGRDIFSRALQGARISLFGSAISLFISMCLGLVLGGFAGFLRGKIADGLFSFITLTVWSFPFIIAVVALTAAIGRGLPATFSALALVNSILIARFVRGEVLSMRERDFILAARALGLGNFRILAKHILPNIFPPVLVTTVLGFSTFISTEAGISFLGLGIQPPAPSWGAMIRDGIPYIGSAWWISFFPGLLLSLCVISASFLAEKVAGGK